jgi:hypothetical protein
VVLQAPMMQTSPGSLLILLLWPLLQVHVLAQAAQAVADADGISCEVLDLRTLLPWDVQVGCGCLFFPMTVIKLLHGFALFLLMRGIGACAH